MKHPCKKCLVKAACSKSCKEYELFRNGSAEKVTMISLFIGIVVFAPLMFYFNGLIEDGHEWASMALTMIWIIGIIIATVLQAPLDKGDQIGLPAIIIFSPFCATCLIAFYLVKPYYGRGLKTRRML